MNWTVFAIVAYLVVALQAGLAGVMRFETSFGDVIPMLPLIPAVLVALYAPPRAIVVAWLVLGVLSDLVTTYPLANDGGLTLIGPYALGYLAGAHIAVQLRAIVVRQHPVTMGFMLLACGGTMYLVWTGVFAARNVFLGEPLAGWSAKWQLLLRLACLGYTAVIGMVAAPVLIKLSPIFGFTSSKPRPGRAVR